MFTLRMLLTVVLPPIALRVKSDSGALAFLAAVEAQVIGVSDGDTLDIRESCRAAASNDPVKLLAFID